MFAESTVIFPLTVDYALSVDQSVVEGRYTSFVNDKITSANFPVEGNEVKDILVELVHFERFISSPDALKEFSKRGLRPATMIEMLAFAAKNPNIQRKCVIVALGAVLDHSLGHHVGYLGGFASQRYVDLGRLDSVWRPSFRFLSVRMYS